MSKKKSRKKTIILVTVLIVVALLVFGYIRFQDRLTASGKTTYDIVGVQHGDIEVKVKGAGTVEPLVDNTVYAAAAGTVVEVNAENGDIVSAGDIIAVFKNDDLETQRDSISDQIDSIDASIKAMRAVTGNDYIKSPVEGAVMVLYAAEDDSVDAVMDKYGALAVVSPDGLMKISVAYDGKLSAGDKVIVTAGSKSVSGVVESTDERAGLVTVSFDGDGFSAGDTAVVSGTSGTQIGEGAIGISSPVYITGRGGTVEKIYENAGDSVKRGGNLFRLDGDILSAELYSKIDQRGRLEADLSDIDEKLDSLEVVAGTDGVISGLSLSPDQTVQAGAKLFTVKSNEQVKIDVDIDELDIADIELGQQASVTFDALPEREFTATVSKINPIGSSQNNVTHFTVTLELDNAQGVMLGMSADVEIVSQRAQGVLYIPIEAIQVINGEKYVVLEQDIDESLDSKPATHKVVTGITDGVSIEIKEGLSETDKVAVPQVKELSLQEQQMQMFGNRMNNSGSNNNSQTSAQGTQAAE